MMPKQEIFQGSMHIIRPFAYIEEKLIKKYVKEREFPIIENKCATSKSSKTLYINKLMQELEKEIARLRELLALVKEVRLAGEDYKWRELRTLLDDNPHMKDGNGSRRKLIIFTEHRDTLNYLHQRIAGVLGNPDAVITIHGGTNRDDRRRLRRAGRATSGRAFSRPARRP